MSEVIEQRLSAMQRFVGSRKPRPGETNTGDEVRRLRKGSRIGRPVLIDSGILIEVSRGRDKAVTARWLELGASDALIRFSPVSAAELWAGARPPEYASLEAAAIGR
jgi:hypothetical protein